MLVLTMNPGCFTTGQPDGTGSTSASCGIVPAQRHPAIIVRDVIRFACLLAYRTRRICVALLSTLSQVTQTFEGSTRRDVHRSAAQDDRADHASAGSASAVAGVVRALGLHAKIVTRLVREVGGFARSPICLAFLATTAPFVVIC